MTVLMKNIRLANSSLALRRGRFLECLQRYLDGFFSPGQRSPALPRFCALKNAHSVFGDLDLSFVGNEMLWLRSSCLPASLKSFLAFGGGAGTRSGRGASHCGLAGEWGEPKRSHVSVVTAWMVSENGVHEEEGGQKKLSTLPRQRQLAPLFVCYPTGWSIFLFRFV